MVPTSRLGHLLSSLPSFRSPPNQRVLSGFFQKLLPEKEGKRKFPAKKFKGKSILQAQDFVPFFHMERT